MSSRVLVTEIPDVLIFEPEVPGSDSDFFLESFNKSAFRDHTGLEVEFVQDNHSRSLKNVLRGLHYQIRQPQGKLVRVVAGEIYDVAVDMRRKSPTFGRWVGFKLSAKDRRSAWIPPGFAHGFLVLSEFAELLYKTTDYYAPQYEKTVIWNDPQICIQWPLDATPVLSDKDARGGRFDDAEAFA